MRGVASVASARVACVALPAMRTRVRAAGGRAGLQNAVGGGRLNASRDFVCELGSMLGAPSCVGILLLSLALGGALVYLWRGARFELWMCIMMCIMMCIACGG